MSELRRDPITHRWTIIAAERALRPSLTASEPIKAKKPRRCPFCPGNEKLTPSEIAAVRSRGGAPNDDTWQIRVIPNKYPALGIEGGLQKAAEGIYDHMSGIGAHEVIIEAPDHDFRLHRLPPKQLLRVLEMYRDRMADLQGDRRFRFSLLFRNHGAAAGASVAHGHAQLIALPIVPKEVTELLGGAERYWAFRSRNVFDDIIAAEVEDGRRLIYDNGHFVAIAPYASRFPFETWLLSRTQSSRFEATPSEQLEHLADALAHVLDRLDRGLGDPPYNFIIRSAPYGQKDVPWYRWHVVVMPTLTHVAGFEWGTDMYINPVAPEEAAEVLRNVPG